MWTPEGKSGLWVWYDDHDWINPSLEAGLNYVLLKAGDGVNVWNQFNSSRVEQIKSTGLACVAWTYCYLDDPTSEAHVAIQAAQKGADAIVLDIEYEAIGKRDAAQTLVSTIKEALPDTHVSYAPDLRIAFGNRWPSGSFNPSAEPFAWDIFNTLDGVFPQLYWVDFAQDPITTLQLSDKWIEGCQAQGWPVPRVYPILPCTAPTREVQQFVNQAVAVGYTGASIWRSNYSNWVGCIQAIGGVQWPVEPAPPEEPQVSDIDMYKTYISEMGKPDGSVIKALDAELAKKQPSKAEIRNIRNRLVSLYKEVTGE